MYNIEIYEDENGRSEIKEYIKELQNKRDKDSRIKYNKIIAYIRMLKEMRFINGRTLYKTFK